MQMFGGRAWQGGPGEQMLLRLCVLLMSENPKDTLWQVRNDPGKESRQGQDVFRLFKST